MTMKVTASGCRAMTGAAATIVKTAYANSRNESNLSSRSKLRNIDDTNLEGQQSDLNRAACVITCRQSFTCSHKAHLHGPQKCVNVEAALKASGIRRGVSAGFTRHDAEGVLVKLEQHVSRSQKVARGVRKERRNNRVPWLQISPRARHRILLSICII
jgi:hypothetical protein